MNRAETNRHRDAPPGSGEGTAETIYFNGKFTAQETTGVQRVAHCMLMALDRRLAAATGTSGRRWVLLCPARGCAPRLESIEVRVVGGANVGLHRWEQWHLPRAAGDGLLVNLAGSGPAFAARQSFTLHDAAIFDRPEAYAWTFLAWYRWLFRRVARTAVAINTVSEFSRERLSERLRLRAERIRLIHSGGDHLVGISPDPSFLGAHGLVDRRFVLAVGSSSANKNLQATIAAFRALGDDDLLLVVVGGRHGAVFAGSAGPETGDGRVVRLGHVGDAALRALYSAAQLLVFVSLYEGFGLPPLEAMSCGCPVLASTAAALPEICGDAALYVDPRSVADIADGLRNLLGTPALREGLIQRGNLRLVSFTWQAAAAKLQAHLEATAAWAAPVSP